MFLLLVRVPLLFRSFVQRFSLLPNKDARLLNKFLISSKRLRMRRFALSLAADDQPADAARQHHRSPEGQSVG